MSPSVSLKLILQLWSLTCSWAWWNSNGCWMSPVKAWQKLWNYRWSRRLINWWRLINFGIVWKSWREPCWTAMIVPKFLLRKFQNSSLKAVSKKESRDRSRSQFWKLLSGQWNVDDINKLIAAAIWKYDNDKTGLPDYALEPAGIDWLHPFRVCSQQSQIVFSTGGTVLSTRCSETYNAYTRKESVFGFPLWYLSYSPRTVIQVDLVGFIFLICF